MTQLVVWIVLCILSHRSGHFLDAQKSGSLLFKEHFKYFDTTAKNRSITNEGQTFLKTSEPSVIK